MPGVPILMYHSVRADPPPETRGLSVDPGMFAAQLGLLRERGFTPVPLSALAGLRAAPGSGPYAGAAKPICITFDDGYADFHTEALPVLESFGYPATVFVTTGWLDDAGPDAAGRPLDAMLTWAHVKEIVEHGVEVGAHSHSHPQLDQLPDGALHDELTRSRLLLEDRLQRPVTTMAYPYGYSSARVRRAVARAGYSSAYVVANDVARERSGYTIPRLTVARGTSLDTFGRIAEGTHGFFREKALTKGYALVRRSRYLYRKTTHHG
ncbi:polysaccharide deacetylase family protein [Actinocorallia sp. API 0066]|uniref:polysaccharide deacetylase family protein n=1 Tax=Actinocorallia sp. API 0066 TaxID=2896846 RepID=UPI001E40171D|nr:polysaccharide deacetylase family protein [Actinocorallia sp. API 0066]MCD0448267.1 polysaccharide deacetylase family protein [Actinocorallia sp. API 0066]